MKTEVDFLESRIASVQTLLDRLSVVLDYRSRNRNQAVSADIRDLIDEDLEFKFLMQLENLGERFSEMVPKIQLDTAKAELKALRAANPHTPSDEKESMAGNAPQSIKLSTSVQHRIPQIKTQSSIISREIINAYPIAMSLHFDCDLRDIHAGKEYVCDVIRNEICLSLDVDPCCVCLLFCVDNTTLEIALTKDDITSSASNMRSPSMMAAELEQQIKDPESHMRQKPAGSHLQQAEIHGLLSKAVCDALLKSQRLIPSEVTTDIQLQPFHELQDRKHGHINVQSSEDGVPCSQLCEGEKMFSGYREGTLDDSRMKEARKEKKNISRSTGKILKQHERTRILKRAVTRNENGSLATATIPKSEAPCHHLNHGTCVVNENPAAPCPRFRGSCLRGMVPKELLQVVEEERTSMHGVNGILNAFQDQAVSKHSTNHTHEAKELTNALEGMILKPQDEAPDDEMLENAERMQKKMQNMVGRSDLNAVNEEFFMTYLEDTESEQSLHQLETKRMSSEMVSASLYQEKVLECEILKREIELLSSIEVEYVEMMVPRYRLEACELKLKNQQGKLQAFQKLLKNQNHLFQTCQTETALTISSLETSTHLLSINMQAAFLAFEKLHVSMKNTEISSIRKSGPYEVPAQSDRLQIRQRQEISIEHLESTRVELSDLTNLVLKLQSELEDTIPRPLVAHLTEEIQAKSTENFVLRNFVSDLMPLTQLISDAVKSSLEETIMLQIEKSDGTSRSRRPNESPQVHVIKIPATNIERLITSNDDGPDDPEGEADDQEGEAGHQIQSQMDVNDFHLFHTWMLPWDPATQASPVVQQRARFFWGDAQVGEAVTMHALKAMLAYKQLANIILADVRCMQELLINIMSGMNLTYKDAGVGCLSLPDLECCSELTYLTNVNHRPERTSATSFEPGMTKDEDEVFSLRRENSALHLDLQQLQRHNMTYKVKLLAAEGQNRILAATMGSCLSSTRFAIAEIVQDAKIMENRMTELGKDMRAMSHIVTSKTETIHALILSPSRAPKRIRGINSAVEKAWDQGCTAVVHPTGGSSCDRASEYSENIICARKPFATSPSPPYTSSRDSDGLADMQKNLSPPRPESTSHPQPPNNTASIGLVIERSQKSGHVHVASVVHGGAAHHDGRIEPHDLLLAVDGAETRLLTSKEILRRVAGPAGSTVELMLMRRPLSPAAAREVFFVSLVRLLLPAAAAANCRSELS